MNNLKVNFIQDKRVPVSRPHFLIAERNSFSCHFGIRYLQDEDFSPNQLALIEHFLKNNLPDIDQHHVVLKQFDVYLNPLSSFRDNRVSYNDILFDLLEGKSILRSVGSILEAILDGESKNNEGFAIDITLDQKYSSNIKHKGNILHGCEGKNMGEVYKNEVPRDGSLKAAVTYLEVILNGMPVKIRTVAPYYPYRNERMPFQDAILLPLDVLVKIIKTEGLLKLSLDI